MGIFDNFSLDNLDDPNKQALLAAGLSMLAPKPYKTGLLGDIGSSGLAGLQTLVQAKQQERANRQNDIQQLTAAAQLLRNGEFARMAQAQQSNQPYTPNPLGGQINARLSQLIMGPNLSKILGGAPASAAPQALAAPPAAAPPPMGVAPPSQSPMASPDYNPPPAAIHPPTPPPQTQANASGLPPGFGGPAGGVPMSVWAAADPTGMAYLKQLAEDNKPIALRQGDLTQKQPDGSYKSVFQQPQSVPGVLPNRDASGQVTSFRQGPGFAEAASNIEAAKTGATEAAKAPYSFQTVEKAGGAKVPASTAQLMGLPNQLQSAGLPFVSPPPPQSGPRVAQVTVTQPSKQAQAVPDDPWATVPKVNTPQGLGQSTYGAALDKQRADKVTKLSDQFGAEADVAGQRIAQNNQALDLVDNADTGWLANHWSEYRGILGTLGVKSAADKAATDQALGKDLIGTALTKGKQLFGSRFTQSEVGIMLSRASPSPEMQKAAIKFLLQTDNAGQQYNIQRGNDFGKYLNETGDPMQFSNWYAQRFPLTKSYEGILPPAAQGGNAATTVRRYNPATGRIE